MLDVELVAFVPDGPEELEDVGAACRLDGLQHRDPALWSILGPLIVIEDLCVFPTLRRSVRLVWPHFLLALVVVAIPTLLEDVPLSMLERFSWYEQPLVRVPVDVLATLVLGGVIGVIEVTLAHALIADEKRRRESAT